jgi:hypothetical protein
LQGELGGEVGSAEQYDVKIKAMAGRRAVWNVMKRRWTK